MFLLYLSILPINFATKRVTRSLVFNNSCVTWGHTFSKSIFLTNGMTKSALSH